MIRRLASTTSDAALRKTPLYNLHVSKGAQMVPFAGYSMPLKYEAQSIVESHNWTRSKASIFDVAHMVQRRFNGPEARQFLERLCPTSLGSLKPMSSTLTVFLNENGGIVDDAIVTKWDEDDFYVVTNAGCREKDNAYFEKHMSRFAGRNIHHEILENQGLIALQGPRASAALQTLTNADLTSLYFGNSAWLNISKLDCKVHVARGGYTGEDGFEISVDPSKTVGLTELLLSSIDNETVQLSGLAARDSLRLEAGMCLYGHDLSEDINPAEASLAWLVSKERRNTDDKANDYLGKARILESLGKDAHPNAPRRVGVVVHEAPAREGATLMHGGIPVGRVTSGCPSPTLQKNIAMGYVPKSIAKIGTDIKVLVRGKERKATIAKLPFIEPKYHRNV